MPQSLDNKEHPMNKKTTPNKGPGFDLILAFVLFLVCILLSLFQPTTGFDFGATVAGLN